MNKDTVRIGNFVVRRVPKEKGRSGLPEIEVRSTSGNWSMAVTPSVTMYGLLDEYIAFASRNKVEGCLYSFINMMIASIYACSTIAPDMELATDIRKAFDAWADRNSVVHTQKEDDKALDDVRKGYGAGV